MSRGFLPAVSQQAQQPHTTRFTVAECAKKPLVGTGGGSWAGGRDSNWPALDTMPAKVRKTHLLQDPNSSSAPAWRHIPTCASSISPQPCTLPSLAPVSLCPVQQYHNGTDSISFPCHVFTTSISIQTVTPSFSMERQISHLYGFFTPTSVPIPLCSTSLIPPPSWSETVPNAKSTLSIVPSQTDQPHSNQPGAGGGEETMVPRCVTRCDQACGTAHTS